MLSESTIKEGDVLVIESDNCTSQYKSAAHFESLQTIANFLIKFLKTIVNYNTLFLQTIVNFLIISMFFKHVIKYHVI